jgi:hypothetical protein
MADVANSLYVIPRQDDARSHDGSILTWCSVALLAVFLLIVAALPFDMANGPAYVPTMFGP